MATADELQIYPGGRLGKCYRVEKFLGEGSFGFVTKCRNTETNEVVAIKVNKNHPHIVHQAREEIAILKKLRCLDPDTCNIVKWNGFFFDKDRICLNFEFLDQSLHNYIQCRCNMGLTMKELRPIIHQLGTTLYHLSSMELIHADLKPDNIMVVNHQEQPLKVKLIDFGLARQVSTVEPGICVQSLWYRAPEVMLEIPFNEAIDMWSLGLVAAELATGRPLYTGDTEYDMLCSINKTQGQPPDHVLDRGMATNLYFKQQRHGQQHWILKKPEETEAETGFCLREREFAGPKCLDDLEQMMVNDGEDQRDRRLLIDLIKRMLHLDPDRRIKPLEVLQHPFFAQNHSERSSPDTNLEGVETPQVNQVDQITEPNPSESSDEMATEDKIEIGFGNKLGERHQMISLLGEGGFGSVIKCINMDTQEVVAVKVIKNNPEEENDIRQEIAILEKLRCLDPATSNIVKWNGFFSHRCYTCLSFEVLEESLDDYISGRGYKGLTMTELRPLIHQLTTAFQQLSSLEILHGDIKPNNIMIANPNQQPLQLKLIDFGMARSVPEVELGLIAGTPGYLAPEVLLQLPYNEAIDMWALGLVVVELATGRPLYNALSEYDMLNLIIKTQGHPPDHMLEGGMLTCHYYNMDSNSQQHWTLKTPEEFRSQTGRDAMDECVPRVRCLNDLKKLMVKDGGDLRDRRLLLNLIKRMLNLDPDQRIKPLEVLQHPFFTRNRSESSQPDTNLEVMETPQVNQVDQIAGPNPSETSHEMATAEKPEVLQHPSFTQNLPEAASLDTSLQAMETPQVNQVDQITEPNPSESSDEMATEDKIEIGFGNKLGERHQMISLLGEGGFGSVIKCINMDTQEVVAVKVIKNNPEEENDIRQEIAILEKLRCLDPATSNIVKWNGFFSHRCYTCLSFEVLEESLDDYISGRGYKGLTMTELRPLIHQLTTAFQQLSSLEILHGDIKPNNIMIANPNQQPLQLKLIDFGMARSVPEVELGLIAGTPGYLAPEVLLQLPYNEAIDMWALGLVVVELATGRPLYNALSEYDMLNLIIKTQGHPPDHMLEGGMLTCHYYNMDSNSQQHWTLKTPEEFRSQTGRDAMDECVPRVRCLNDLKKLMVKNGGDLRDRRLLLNLIKRMLNLDPDQRIKPLEVLQHPFFTRNRSESSQPDTNLEVMETPQVNQVDQIAGPNPSAANGP